METEFTSLKHSEEKMQVENLLRDLIKIPSPSGEEKEIGEFIADRLSKNFKIKKQKVGRILHFIVNFVKNPY